MIPTPTIDPVTAAELSDPAALFITFLPAIALFVMFLFLAARTASFHRARQRPGEIPEQGWTGGLAVEKVDPDERFARVTR
jgi:hypothetical protein